MIKQEFENTKNKLSQEANPIMQLDIIDTFINNIRNYHCFGYTGKLPPLTGDVFWTKHSVEDNATLYLMSKDNAPDNWAEYGTTPFSGGYKMVYDDCYILNKSLSVSEVKSKNCDNYITYQSGNYTYIKGDYKLPSRLGKTVYNYWKYLVDNNYTHERQKTEVFELIQEYSKKLNRAEILQKAMELPHQ